MKKNFKVFFTFVIGLALTFNNAGAWNRIFSKQETQPQKTKVGVVFLEGMIDNTKDLQLKLWNINKDDTIKGVLLIVNSPGGATDASFALSQVLKQVSEKKPIVTVVTGGCMSGAYFAAANTDYIICPEFSEIGSIGTYFYQESDQSKKDSVNQKFFIGGKRKALYHPSKVLTEEEKAYCQSETDARYKRYCKMVADLRGLKAEDSSIWADGQVFLGTDAVSLGLADKVGSITDADQILIEKITEKFPNEAPQTLEYVYFENTNNQKQQ